MGFKKKKQSKLSFKNERKIDSFRDFPDGPVVKNLPSSAGDAGSIPDLGTKIPYPTTKTQHSQINE